MMTAALVLAIVVLAAWSATSLFVVYHDEGTTWTQRVMTVLAPVSAASAGFLCGVIRTLNQ